MPPTLPQFSIARIRSYTLRLPLFTRVAIGLIIIFWCLGLQSSWDVRQWGSLIPMEIGVSTLYRTNTFALIHAGVIHASLNLLALVPLLERFESENGTLTSIALFLGPFSTIPAIAYTIIQRGLLRSNTAVLGASVWVFLLIGIEAIKAYRTNPYFMLGDVKIPTWTTPMALLLFVTVLVPNTSLIGHLCGLVVGYLYGLGYIKFLAPPEWALRWLESKLNLLGRLPHYVSVDQKTYGRYGVLPTTSTSIPNLPESGMPMGYVGSTQRLGP